MARHFSKEEVDELRARIAATSKKDTDFETAKELGVHDLVAIVQGGVNKKVEVSKFSEGLTADLRKYVDDKVSECKDDISDLSARVVTVEKDNEALHDAVAALSVNIDELKDADKKLDAKIDSVAVSLENVELKAEDAMQHADLCLDLLTWKEINK